MKRKTEFAWERQPGESEEAYAAFTVYYTARLERSIRKTAEKVGKSRVLMERWSRRWNWVDRAREYDNALAREEFKSTVRAVREMNAYQASVGKLLLSKGVKALSKMKDEKLVKMDAKTLLQFLVQGCGIERRARMSDVSIQAKQRVQEEHSTEYADDGLSEALSEAAKKVWKK